MTFSDGRKYTGEYLNDKKHGIGTFEWRILNLRNINILKDS